MFTLSTLHRLRQHLGFAAADTAEDRRLLHVLQAAAQLMERYAGRRFEPRSATLWHDVPRDDPTTLLLQDDLLALTSLTNGDGQAISLAQVQRLPGNRLRLLPAAGGFVYSASPYAALGVTGIWGWHPDWEAAWRSSADAVQDAPLSAAAATLTVSAAAGAAADQEQPRFQVGQLLQVEAEYLRVVAVNTVSNTLAVQRGAQGTTPAAHAQGTPILIYQPAPDAELLCIRLAAWFYREPDTLNGSGVPPMLRPMLDTLRKVRV